jgi:hypothetical protein
MGSVNYGQIPKTDPVIYSYNISLLTGSENMFTGVPAGAYEFNISFQGSDDATSGRHLNISSPSGEGLKVPFTKTDGDGHNCYMYRHYIQSTSSGTWIIQADGDSTWNVRYVQVTMKRVYDY